MSADWTRIHTYGEVSRVESGVGMVPVASDAGRLQDCSVLQIDAGGAVPQEAGVARSLGGRGGGTTRVNE